MIIIGATARQSGKTELASGIIKNFCKKEKITGIKVTILHEGDASFHRSMNLPLDENFIIEKSAVNEKNKSTDRMLAAGAIETYWVHSKAEFLNDALQQLLPMIDKNSFIVCESNSLRKFVEPDIFIMILNKTSSVKKSAADILKLADLIIESDGKEFINFDFSRIGISNGKWVLNKE